MQNLNNIRRFLAIVAVVASLLVVSTILLRMRQTAPPKLGVDKLPVQVDVSLQNVHYTETKEGVKRWDLQADRAEYNKATDTTSLSGVRFLLAGSAGGDLQVTAEHAEYKNATKDVLLSGNVHGRSSKGFEFFAPSVTYLAARSVLESTERVRLADAGMELEGVGMEFQTKTRKFRLLKDVSAIYRQQGGRR